MKILLTGSTGFLGKEVETLLSKKKIKIIKICKKKKKNYFSCNLENKEEVNKLLNLTKPDIIINLAAKIDFNNKKINFFKVNSYLPKLLSDYCKKKNKYLIQASTIAVHGKMKKYTPKTKYLPKSNYAISKLNGDKAIIKSNCKYCIIRFPGIYGINGPKHLFLNKFLTRRKFYNIKINNNGEQLRNYIYVKDAAKVILKCLKNKKKKILYLGGEKISIKNILLLLMKHGFIKNIEFNKQKTQNQIVINNLKLKISSFEKNLKLMKKLI